MQLIDFKYIYYVYFSSNSKCSRCNHERVGYNRDFFTLMTQSNTLYEFIRLSDARNLPFSLTQKNNFLGIQVFEYALEMISHTFYLHALPFDLHEHKIEVYSTPFYNQVFDDIQFGFLKYELILRNAELDRTHRVEMFVTEEGFIDDIYVYSSTEAEHIEQSQLPRAQLDEIIEKSNNIIRPFYSQMYEAKKQYVQTLEAEFQDCAQQIYDICFESKAAEISEYFRSFIDKLYRLSMLAPKDYALLFQNFSNILRRAEPFSASIDMVSDHSLQLLPSMQEMQDVLHQRLPKSKRIENDKITFHHDYLEQVMRVMGLMEDMLEKVFSVDEEISYSEQLAQGVAYCVIKQRFLKFILEFLNAQVIIKDYSFFETTLEICGHRVLPAVLESLVKQERVEEFAQLLEVIQLSYEEIHRLIEKIIVIDHACFMCLNSTYPIDFLQLDQENKPLGCLVLRLPFEDLNRQYLLKEHRQFRSISFYQRMVNILMEMPYTYVKEDLILASSVLKGLQPPSSSSISMFKTKRTQDRQWQESIMASRLKQEEVKNKINQLQSITFNISEQLMQMLNALIDTFQKIILLSEPRTTMLYFGKFNEALEFIMKIVALCEKLKDRKAFSNRDAKNQSTAMLETLGTLMGKLYDKYSDLEQMASSYMKGMNTLIITRIANLIGGLDEYKKNPSPTLIDVIQREYRAVQAQSHVLDLKDREIIEKLFYLPLDTIIQTVGCEIQEFQKMPVAGMQMKR